MTRVALTSALFCVCLLFGCKNDQERAIEGFAAASATDDNVTAIALLQEVTTLDPRLHGAWAELAKRQFATEQFGAAKTSIEKAITLADLAAYRMTLGDVHIAAMEYDNAIAAYDEALSGGGDVEALNARLASALSSRGDVRVIEARELSNADQAAEREAKYTAALSDFGRALSLEPTRTMLHFRMGQVHRALVGDSSSFEHRQAAATAYRAAIAAEVEPFASRMGIAELLIGNPRGAVPSIVGSTPNPPAEEAKILALLEEAQGLASTDEERARHGAAKATMDERASARGQLAAAAGAPVSRGQRPARPDEAEALLLGALGGEVTDVFASGRTGSLEVISMLGGGRGGSRPPLGAMRGGPGFVPLMAGSNTLGPPQLRRSTIRYRDIRVQGPLPQPIVTRGVRRRGSAFRRCYDAELRRDGRLKGSVVLSATVRSTGAVSDVRITENLHQVRVGQCMRNVLRRLRFPAQASDSTFTMEIQLTPPGP